MSPRQFWNSFRWQFAQGLGIVHLPWCRAAAILLAIALLISLLAQRPFAQGRWRSYYWLLLTQLLFHPAAIAIGALYARDQFPSGPVPPIDPIANGSLYGIFYLSLALGAFWIYRLEDFRWFAFCFVALAEVFLMGALLVASMSVTGDWI